MKIIRHLAFVPLVCLVCATSLAQNYKKVHKQTLLIDTHDDVISRLLEEDADLAKEQTHLEFDLVKAKKGGLKAQVFSIWGDEKIGYKHAQREIDTLMVLINRHPDKISLVKDAQSLRSTVKQGKLAAMIGVEGGHMIDNDLSKIDSLAARGMIYLTLTWNNSTNWASSAVDERGAKLGGRKPGLDGFGQEVVKRLNQLGVMVDLSHVGEQTFFDAIKLSTKPVILSHSCAYAINPVPRNIKDEQILALGKNGGLISINFYNGFVDPNYDKEFSKFMDRHRAEYQQLLKDKQSDARRKLIEKYSSEFEQIKPNIDLLVDHIDHIVKLIGIDHVGIGADYDGATSYPQQLANVADYPNLTKALLKRGYTLTDIKKIYGENFLRVLKANKGS